MSAVKNVALMALGAAGAVVAINQIAKPAKTQGLGSVIGRKMSEYNQIVHPEQDRTLVSSLSLPIKSVHIQAKTNVASNRDTIFDRTALLNDAKAKNPWNMTASERAVWKEQGH